jgi:hypothetical protein
VRRAARRWPDLQRRGYAANKLCDLHGGHRYIVGDDPDMAGAFECIAKVGASGGDPLMGDAMIAALSPKLNGPGGCNEGFLREDALLVVALISDFERPSRSPTPRRSTRRSSRPRGTRAPSSCSRSTPQPYQEGRDP